MLKTADTKRDIVLFPPGNAYPRLLFAVRGIINPRARKTRRAVGNNKTGRGSSFTILSEKGMCPRRHVPLAEL